MILAQRANKPGTIIPLFYPPDDVFPSQIGCMKSKDLSASSLSADIVHLAVRGFITISYQSGIVYGGEYTLQLNEQAMELENQQNLSESDYVIKSTIGGINMVFTSDQCLSLILPALKTHWLS